MKQKPDIENKIDSVLNSLDGIRRATPTPYFFTRLQARMAKGEKEWGGLIGFISKPVYALAMVCIVLSINTWIVFKDTDDTLPANVFSTANANDLPEEEYNVAVTTFYNYDTP
jgi:hypothetical protein